MLIGNSTITMKSGGSSSSQISALVVDDDFVIRQIHSAMLKSFGVNVQLAVNGKEAVDLFRSGTNVHIVFMDMDMPVMNGIMVYIYIYINIFNILQYYYI